MTKFGVTVNVDAFRVSEMGKYQQINTIISSHLKTSNSQVRPDMAVANDERRPSWDML